MKEFAESRSVFPFLRRVCEWLRLQKLEHELRYSRSFQRRCEEIGCPNLAELEEGYQKLLAHKISRLQMAQTEKEFQPVRKTVT